MIYDCFPFLNEVDLLEIRFRELGDLVDQFVIFESVRDHRGVPRTPKLVRVLYDTERFARWRSRVTPILAMRADWKLETVRQFYLDEGDIIIWSGLDAGSGKVLDGGEFMRDL